MGKPTFGVSTWLWTSPFNGEALALFPIIKSMGFDVVEIPVEDPDLIPIEETRQALADNGLSPIICGAFGPTKDLTHDDPAVHLRCFDYIQACFDIGNALGGNFLAGPMYSAVGKARMLPEDQRKREWDLAVQNLQKVCQMAAESGQLIALEPLNRFESDLVNTAEDVRRMITDINHPAARILLDSFHMTIEEKDIRAAINTAGDKLLHIQVSENHRGVPGTGLTPWADFAEGVKDIQYQGTISIESFTPNNLELAGAVCIWKTMAESQDAFAQKGLHFLRQLFN
jgi:D-psicose/D-tagatose/L-ribulose 3-epimerase